MACPSRPADDHHSDPEPSPPTPALCTSPSATSTPTVCGPSPEKLSCSPPPSSPPEARSLRPDQRLANALSREAAEASLAAREIIHFARHHNWRKTLRTAFQPKYWGWWLLLLLLLVLSSLLSSYHTKVALRLKPYQAQIRAASCSWLVPTILLVIVSFPPLFGHELIILVAGMIWGLWIGFAIACAGTFVGEMLTYYAFKYLISGRAARAEASSVTYASLATLMREGGLGMVVLVRASALPGHVCTAIQATIGIRLWVFTLACIVTLPKQFALVYLGLLLADPATDPHDPHPAEAATHHRISAAVFLLTALFTLLSAYIVGMRLRKIRPRIQRQFALRNLPPPDEKLPRLHDHPFYHSPTEPQSPAPVYAHPLAV